MNYLAIDTSGKNLTIVLSVNEKKYIHNDNAGGVTHAVGLMPNVERLFLQADFSPKDLDFLACVVGAGSFTGIRIGVSTVKGLCFAYNKPCLAITSFDTIAYNKQGEKTLAVIDAKHNGYYVCGYQNNAVCYPPTYLLKDQVLELSKQFKILSCDNLIDFDYEKVNVVDGLVKAVEEKKDQVSFDLESLVPLYVRKSQAEEGR